MILYYQKNNKNDRKSITFERFHWVKELGKKFIATITATISAYVNISVERDFNEEKKVVTENQLEESVGSLNGLVNKIKVKVEVL